MMKHAVKHGMADVDRVRAALDRAYKANADRFAPYSPRMVWNSNHVATVSVTVMTKTITTGFTITDDEVLVEGKLPFLFSHLEEKIARGLGEQLEAWFAKERADEA